MCIYTSSSTLANSRPPLLSVHIMRYWCAVRLYYRHSIVASVVVLVLLPIYYTKLTTISTSSIVVLVLAETKCVLLHPQASDDDVRS